MNGAAKWTTLLPGSGDLGRHVFVGGGGEDPRGGRIRIRPGRTGRRAAHFRTPGILDDQGSRGNQTSDAGVAELAEHAKYTPVVGLRPHFLPPGEITAYCRSFDARVRGGAIKGNQPALSPP